MRRASARLAREPVARLSTTSTECPSARSRSTSVDPIKPAPPVTSAFTVRSWGDGHLGAGQAGSRGNDRPVADDRKIGYYGSRLDVGPSPDDGRADLGARTHGD